MTKSGIAAKVAGLSFMFVALAGSTPASAALAGAVRPALVGGINSMTNTGGGLGYRGGVNVAFWMGPTFDFTVGGEYLSRAFEFMDNANFIQVPGLFNLHIGPMFSVGAGGFYDFALTSGFTKNYGFSGDVRFKPVGLPLFLEGRYNHGMDTEDMPEASREFVVMLGFTF